MTKFEKGDRVVVREYDTGDAKGYCYGTIQSISESSAWAEDWTLGSPKGWLPLSLLEKVEPPLSPDSKIDLATVQPMDADTLGLALVVGGQTKTFTISRSSAASLAGRIAEALAK